MALHDRRPRAKTDKFTNAKYSALFQSSHWETLQTYVNETIEKLSRELPTGDTVDSYALAALKRDGRVEGLRLLLKDIELLANKD